MLRSIVVMDRIGVNTPPQIIWDAPRPIRDDVEPVSSAQPDAPPTRDTPPLTAHDAVQNYARLRT
jgi:hypothetical protein